jgi:hypothetical protein
MEFNWFYGHNINLQNTEGVHLKLFYASKVIIGGHFSKHITQNKGSDLVMTVCELEKFLAWAFPCNTSFLSISHQALETFSWNLIYVFGIRIGGYYQRTITDVEFDRIITCC